MKLKGISWAEQHVEKIVLGGVSVAFLGVVAAQFLWQPNRITVAKGGGEPLPPGRAFEPAKQRAAALAAAMDRPEDDLRASLPPPATSTIVADFQRAHAAPVAPASTITPLGPAIALGPVDASITGGGGRDPIAAIAVPAPSGPVAAVYVGTVDPAQVVSNAALKAALPKEQPFDAIGVSVQASFSGPALRAALAADPDGPGGSRPIPSGWWSGAAGPESAVEILGVRLERAERRPDGSWSDPVAVTPVPSGPDDVLAAAAQAKSPGDLGAVVSAARTAGNAATPPYVRLIAGTTWAPPRDIAGTGGEERRVRVEALERRERTAQDNIRRATAGLERLDREANRPQPATPQQTPRTGGGNAPPPPPPRPEAGGGSDPRQAQRQRLQDQLKAAEDELASIREELRTLGVVRAGAPAAGAPATQPAVQPSTARTPLFEDADLELWAHDLSARPGGVYRYRVAVIINNPAFGRGALLPDAQQELASTPTIVGQPSAWTEPLELPADQYFFVTAASPADAMGPARVTLDVYKLFYGYFRRASVTVEPGDRIAASGIRVPDKARLPIYDLSKIAAGSVPTPGLPPAPGEAPPNPRQWGGGPADERDPSGRGGMAPGGPAEPTLPPDAMPWAGTLNAAFGFYLVDVASTVSGNATKTEVLFGGEGGALVRRSPEAERNSELVRLLQRSVKDGETQGQPATPSDPRTPAPGERPTPTPGGRGGRGGGG